MWQREWLQGPILDQQLAYWRDRLAGIPPLLDLPFDRARPPSLSLQGAIHPFILLDSLHAPLMRLSQDEQATLFMTLLAAFQVLLSRYSGQTDIVVGASVANRMQPELAGLIGFFVNNLVLRTDTSGAPSFRELLRRVREVCLGAYSHQDIPFEVLVKELNPQRNLSYTPLFQVAFNLQPVLVPALECAGVLLRPMTIDTGTAKVDLSLFIWENDMHLTGSVEYNTDLFDTTTIIRMIQHYQVLLAGIVANPSQPITELSILTDNERQMLLVDWNATQYVFGSQKPATSRDSDLCCLHERIEAQAAQTPDRIALFCDQAQLTYSMLNDRADALASHLCMMGVGPEVRVGIYMDRSLELMVGMLAVLKAGGAYVPLDLHYPIERLAFMIEDSGVAVLITDQGIDDLRLTIDDLEESNTPIVNRKSKIVNVVADWPQIARMRTDAAPRRAHADNLAYIIYTSGSTGTPKGVSISHRSTVALLDWARTIFAPEDLAGVLASTSICFDLSVFELFVPLSCGGAVILAQNALQLPALPCAAAVTLVNTVPSAIAALLRLDGLPPSVRTINLAGEPLPLPLAQQLYAREQTRKLFNLYGPSEDTVYSTCALLPHDSSLPPAIGRPIVNTQVYLLDRWLRPVPIGVPGELYLGGAGLARGYLNRPDLTAERFVPNPFAEMSGIGYRVLGADPSDTRYLTPDTRLYKTGDLARYRPDGTLEFLGRVDQQVKLRGYRVELGEIEAVLAQHPAVRASAVLVREDTPGDQRLVAYVVPTETLNAEGRTMNGPEWSSSAFSVQRSALAVELRAFLGAKLPEYMLPSLFVVLDVLPLTPSGKLDRRNLPAPSQDLPVREQAFLAPRTPIEKALADIWAQVLGHERIGVHDNFFDLGGHSLLAVHVVTHMRVAFQIDLPARCIFEMPTIEELAKNVELTQWAIQSVSLSRELSDSSRESGRL